MFVSKKITFCVIVLNLHRKHINVYINFNLVHTFSVCALILLWLLCVACSKFYGNGHVNTYMHL